MSHRQIPRSVFSCLLYLLLFASCGPAAASTRQLVNPTTAILPALNRPIPPSPLSNHGGSVQVWLTTSDNTHLLAQQSSVSFAADGGPNLMTITVNEQISYQQMDGFGGAFTDTSAWLVAKSLSEEQRFSLMRRLFDPASGIGLSFLRQPIGASDFTVSSVPYSYDDVPPGQSDPQLANFSITHDQAYIIPVLQQALRMNPKIKIMASLWSPPAWMKVNGSMLNGGQLLPGSYAPLASYFVKFIQAYNGAGLPIYAITPQNEPGAVTPYPSMVLFPSDAAKLIKNDLGPALARSHLRTKILVDDWYYDTGYANAVYSDPGANPFVAGSAHHCYAGPVSAMTLLHRSFPQKEAYETECSSGTSPNNPPVDSLIAATRNWARAVLLWNIAEDIRNGPVLPGGCAVCTPLVTIDQKSGAITYRRDYYHLGHASKFVIPGSFRIASNTFGSGSIQDVAFKNPAGTLVLIVHNTAPSSRTFKVRWGKVSFRYTLPTDAIATFKWSSQTAQV